MIGTITIDWDNDNCLGQWQLFGTMTIVWDNDNSLGKSTMIFVDCRRFEKIYEDFYSSEVAAAVSTANYCSAAKSPF